MHVWDKVRRFYKNFLIRIDRYIIVPVFKGIIALLSKKRGLRRNNGMPVWKKNILADFNVWLTEVSDDFLMPDEVTAESCDKFAVLSFFARLRQELRDKNGGQRAVIGMTEMLLGEHRHLNDLFKKRGQELVELEDSVRVIAEEKTVTPLLEVRDALVRGLRVSRSMADAKGFLCSPPKGIDVVIMDYEKIIRSLDRTLAYNGFRQIRTVNQRFNPGFMRAVGKGSIPSMQKGIVLEESLSGFVRNGRLVRAAEVIINE